MSAAAMPLLRVMPSQTTTGYRVEVVTVRKLEFETDAFAFADKVGCCWVVPSLQAASSKLMAS